MTAKTWDNIGALATVILLAFSAMWLVFTMVDRMQLARECFSLGYPETRMSVMFEKYCVARENQSDIVLPIEEARKRPR
jgi:hypothetical protein